MYKRNRLTQSDEAITIELRVMLDATAVEEDTNTTPDQTADQEGPSDTESQIIPTIRPFSKPGSEELSHEEAYNAGVKEGKKDKEEGNPYVIDLPKRYEPVFDTYQSGYIDGYGGHSNDPPQVNTESDPEPEVIPKVPSFSKPGSEELSHEEAYNAGVEEGKKDKEERNPYVIDLPIRYQPVFDSYEAGYIDGFGGHPNVRPEVNELDENGESKPVQ